MSAENDKISEHLAGGRDAAITELKELLRIPSVSTDSARSDDVKACAHWVATRMSAMGLEAEIFETARHPVVFAERRAEATDCPTVLIYGHYDVQPPDPIDAWHHDPFEPVQDGEYLVARGSSDDKGQFYALLKGVEAVLLKEPELPVNVKVIIEGEEEIGSPNLLPFVEREKDRLAADVAVIADCSQFARDVPAITYGLKGLVYLELVVRGAKRDLHSGSYGGAVANPANALTRMVAACHGPFGRIAIPGFYDKVLDLEADEREEFARLPFDEETFRGELGVPELVGEEGFTTLERKWGRPTFDVNGLISGFTGEGAKTVLPNEARAKISMRLVPDQDPVEIRELVTAFLQDVAPPGVTIEVLDLHDAKPVLVPRTGKAVDAAIRGYEVGFGRRPVFVREGGSIPVVNTLQEVLGVPTLLLGLGLPDDGIHGPNERFRIEDYHRGALTMATFLQEIARE